MANDIKNDDPIVEVVHHHAIPVVPEFIREAVNRLENPRQARLLLKLLRSYSPLGRGLPKDKLDALVTRVLATELNEPEPTLKIRGVSTDIVILDDMESFQADNPELVKELQFAAGIAVPGSESIPGDVDIVMTMRDVPGTFESEPLRVTYEKLRKP